MTLATNSVRNAERGAIIWDAGQSSGKISSSDIRANNISMIFQLLFPANRLSRAELGRCTGLSRMAISDVTAEMMNNGIIREVGEDQRTGRGKRSAILALDTAHWRVCVVDLSEPYLVKSAIVDLYGRVVDRIELARDDIRQISVDDVIEAIDRISAQTDLPLLGIGVAVPGVVDCEGDVVHAVRFGWKNIPLRAMLEDHYGIPVLVNNCTDMALVGEKQFGTAAANSMLIRIGLGIGVAVSLNNEIVEGEHYMAGEIGHIIVDPSGPECECGKQGCLEAYLSVPRLERMIVNTPERRTEILANAGEILGRVMAVSVGLLDIENICVYGSNLIGDAFLGAMAEELGVLMNTEYRHAPVVKRCEQGDSLTIRGEAINVLEHCIPTIRSAAE